MEQDGSLEISLMKMELLLEVKLGLLLKIIIKKGTDYDETFALIARLETILMLLAFACVINFKPFQMDVKSSFLNDYIMEEVYIQ